MTSYQNRLPLIKSANLSIPLTFPAGRVLVLNHARTQPRAHLRGGISPVHTPKLRHKFFFFCTNLSPNPERNPQYCPSANKLFPEFAKKTNYTYSYTRAPPRQKPHTSTHTNKLRRSDTLNDASLPTRSFLLFNQQSATPTIHALPLSYERDERTDNIAPLHGRQYQIFVNERDFTPLHNHSSCA